MHRAVPSSALGELQAQSLLDLGEEVFATQTLLQVLEQVNIPPLLFHVLFWGGRLRAPLLFTRLNLI